MNESSEDNPPVVVFEAQRVRDSLTEGVTTLFAQENQPAWIEPSELRVDTPEKLLPQDEEVVEKLAVEDQPVVVAYDQNLESPAAEQRALRDEKVVPTPQVAPTPEIREAEVLRDLDLFKFLDPGRRINFDATLKIPFFEQETPVRLAIAHPDFSLAEWQAFKNKYLLDGVWKPADDEILILPGKNGGLVAVAHHWGIPLETRSNGSSRPAR